MTNNYNLACREFYSNSYEEEFNELTSKALSHNRKGKISDYKLAEIETSAQKCAICESLLSGMRKFPDVPVGDIWEAIFRAHMYRKSGIEDPVIIDKVVSADQSWKKSSGHAFEEMIKKLGDINLKDTGISIILQRDLSDIIKTKKLANEPRDISWLKEQIRSDTFDLYAIIREEEKIFCFGCIQAKTSIRDRVTRDREPSIQAMQSFFWSSIIVLDGDFLKLPKFQNMVNGGVSEFPINGWHGMYVFSDIIQNDRIYRTDLQLSTFIDHIQKAAHDWRTQRQWLTETWKTDNTTV